MMNWLLWLSSEQHGDHGTDNFLACSTTSITAFSHHVI